MSTKLRRYEIFLPRRFNDGKRIPEHLAADTLLELRLGFGAVSCETQAIHGVWQHGGLTFRDELTRIFVDVADTRKNRKFFQDYKKRLKVRFNQLDMWMTTYQVKSVE